VRLVGYLKINCENWFWPRDMHMHWTVYPSIFRKIPRWYYRKRHDAFILRPSWNTVITLQFIIRY